MHVRTLTPDEAPKYVSLRREMLADAPWAFAASELDDRGLDEAGVTSSIAAGAKNNDYAIIGAFDGEVLVGVALLLRTRLIKMRHRVDVVSVYITPSHRGKRLGDAIFDEAKRLARSWQGVDSLRLSVSVRSPAAQRLYERNGFVRWGLEPGCLCVNGQLIDEVHMVCML
ncbi:MAG TPA: GNAT family N-acetyltransferase [Phycisphaerales bacterium]|nr:GNAT family N-acetyltransferase [Phycisphaerales bacterium]